MARLRLTGAVSVALCVLAAVAIVPRPAGAAPGDLDPTFASGGIAHLTLGPGRGAAQARALALQADGRLVVGGLDFGRSADFVLVRLRADGTLDPTFSRDGIARTDFAGRGGSVQALAVLPDGKILAAGEMITETSESRRFAIARYCPNGALDDTAGCGSPGFGDLGKVTTDFGAGEEVAKAIALMPDGRFVIGGYARAGHGWVRFALARYFPGGALDMSFGGDGRVTTNCTDSFTDGRENNFITALALRPDGGVLAVGQVSNPDGPRLVIMQYTADGAPDPDFNDGQCFAPHLIYAGAYTDVFGGGRGLVLHDDGGFSIGGFEAAGNFAVWRFRANGAADPGFAVTPGGLGGFRRITFPGGRAAANALIPAPGGGLVAAGCVDCSLAGGNRLALARLHADGTLDLGFGAASGKVVTEIGDDAAAYALVRQPDDKLVAAGYAVAEPVGESFALARYLDVPDFSRFSRFWFLRGLIGFILFGIHTTSASVNLFLEVVTQGVPVTIPLNVLDARPGAHELGVLAQLPAAVPPGKARLHILVDKQPVAEAQIEIATATAPGEHAKGAEDAVRLVADLFRGQSVDRMDLGAGKDECKARRQDGRKSLARAADAEARALRELFGGGAATGRATAAVHGLASELGQALAQALECGQTPP